MPVKFLFLSGPFNSDDKVHGFDDNILRISKIALQAAERGWGIIVPHKMTAGFQHSSVSDKFWVEMYLEMLSRSADAILMCPGWSSSPGSLKEMERAKAEGIPIFYYEDGIPDTDEVDERQVK